MDCGSVKCVNRAPSRSSLLIRVRQRVSRWCWGGVWRHRLGALGPGSWIEGPAWVFNGKGVRVGSNVSVWRGARLESFRVDSGLGRIEIGDGSVIQPGVHIGAAERVSIGRGVLMASHVYITDHDHDWSNADEPVITHRRLSVAPVEIGDYAWLGERVMVLKGVRVGEHSIIGAGSVVTRSVPAYCVAVGSPARVVRKWDAATRSWVRV